MPLRMIPLLLVAALVVMFAVGAFADRSDTTDGSLANDILTEVNGVLNDALDESTFDRLNDSMNGFADTVQGTVKAATN